MRLGFLIDSFAVGGTELNAIKVAEGLTRRSAVLTVFHFRDDGPLRERYERLRVQLIRVPLHGFLSTSALRAIAQIRAGAREHRLQLLHSHCVYSNILSIGIRSATLPVLASRRWTGYAARPGLHLLNRIAQTTADAVLVNSPSLLRVVSEESPRSKPRYVPNLLPDDYFRIVSPAERSSYRARFDIPADVPVAGCVARLEPVKDHRTLLAAWQTVVQRIPAARLLIIGDGSLRSDLEALARELSIASSVIFTGTLPAQSLPQSMMDAAVLTSSDEGFPNTLLEAMAQRIPVVSTNVGGVGDLITHGKNGLLTSAGDVAGISAALQRLLRGGQQVTDLAAAGAQTAALHQEDYVMTALMEVYGEIART